MKTHLGKILGYLQIFIGMGAVAGAIPMLVTPNGSSNGLTVELLQNTPFKNFLVPGLFLFFINGTGSLIASYFSLKALKPAGFLGMILGVALMIWIIVQVYYLGFSSWLQPLYLALGTLEFIMSIILFRKSTLQ